MYLYLRILRNVFTICRTKPLKTFVKHASSISNTNKEREMLHQVPILREIFATNRSLTIDEWSNLRMKVLSIGPYISEINIDAVIIGHCMPNAQLGIAKSYISYLKHTGIEPNLATLGRFLKIFHSAAQAKTENIVEDDRNEIINLYNNIITKSPALDATTCENLIFALSLTNEWPKCFELLDMIKIISIPSVTVYSILISKTFQANDIVTGWRLLEEMVSFEKIPKCEVFISYFEYCKKDTDKFPENVEKILYFMGEHKITVSKQVVEALKQFYEYNCFACQFVSIAKNGSCKSCKSTLERVQVTNEEYKQLSTSFLQKVLIRKNVFQKSTPQEVNKFEKFLEMTAPYNCVIDGLNIAFSTGINKNNKFYSTLLAAVVKYFGEKNKKVLVLGRKHMNSWPKAQMNYIRSNSHLFLTEDLSHDDPFLLYAALKSGPETNFFSRDLMRTHAFLLGKELKPIFRRWQQQHQYYIEKSFNGKINVQEPVKFNVNAHKSNGNWHIPFRNEYSAKPPETFGMSDSWLCISTKNMT